MTKKRMMACRVIAMGVLSAFLFVGVSSGKAQLRNGLIGYWPLNEGDGTTTATVLAQAIVREGLKAVTAGTCHDIFNVLTCIILFPLELKYGVLSQLSHSLASLFDLSTANSPTTEKFFIYTFLDKIYLFF